MQTLEKLPYISPDYQKNFSLRKRIGRDLRRNKHIYMMLIPAIAFYIIFCYKPMYGAIIAFKDFSPMLGIVKSPWVGLENFRDFMGSTNFLLVFRNTVLISLYQLIFGFPAPIILALLLNEVKNKIFKQTVQTLTYIPHFISIVVVCSMIREFTVSSGIINDIVALFGVKRVSMLMKPELFRTIYVASDIWQSVGWGTIVYLAALTSIDAEIYEASKIDGAGRWKQMLNITLPGIQPTVIIMLILQLGSIMNVGFEKILLLYNPLTYSTADVISTYVYRKGIMEFSYSFSTAVGLFNSVINFFMVFSANWICKKFNETSLW